MINIQHQPNAYNTLAHNLTVIVTASPQETGNKRHYLTYQLFKNGVPLRIEKAINFIDNESIEFNFYDAIRESLHLILPPGYYTSGNIFSANDMQADYKVVFKMMELDITTCDDAIEIETVETNVFKVLNSSMLFEDNSIGNAFIMNIFPNSISIPNTGFDFLYIASNDGSLVHVEFIIYFSDGTTYTKIENNILPTIYKISKNLILSFKEIVNIEVRINNTKITMYHFKDCNDEAIMFQSTGGGLSVLWINRITETVQANSKTYQIYEEKFKNIDKHYHYIKHFKLYEYVFNIDKRIFDLLNTQWIGHLKENELIRHLIYRHDFTHTINEGSILHISLKLLKDYKRPNP